MLRKSKAKIDEENRLKQLRYLNNPEDASKNGIICVNTEDTSSGSAA